MFPRLKKLINNDVSRIAPVWLGVTGTCTALGILGGGLCVGIDNARNETLVTKPYHFGTGFAMGGALGGCYGLVSGAVVAVPISLAAACPTLAVAAGMGAAGKAAHYAYQNRSRYYYRSRLFFSKPSTQAVSTSSSSQEATHSPKL